MNTDEPTSDVVVILRRSHATIVGETPKGKLWMQQNCILTTAHVHTISRDVVEEFLVNLKEAELTYEER